MLACPVLLVATVHGGEGGEGDAGDAGDENDAAAVLLHELLKTDW